MLMLQINSAETLLMWPIYKVHTLNGLSLFSGIGLWGFGEISPRCRYLGKCWSCFQQINFYSKTCENQDTSIVSIKFVCCPIFNNFLVNTLDATFFIQPHQNIHHYQTSVKFDTYLKTYFVRPNVFIKYWSHFETESLQIKN